MDVEEEKGTVMNWKKLAKATNFTIIAILSYAVVGAVIYALTIWNPTIAAIVVAISAFIFLVWIAYKML